MRFLLVLLLFTPVFCTSQFTLVRTGDAEFPWVRGTNTSISSLHVSGSLQYMMAASETSAKFYRITMYPSQYPTWPYLLYGCLNLPRGQTALGWTLGFDQSLVAVAYKSGASVRLSVYSKQPAKFSTPSTLFSPTSRSYGYAGDAFDVYEPQYDYNDAWTADEDSFVPLLHNQVVSAEIPVFPVVSSNGNFIALAAGERMYWQSRATKRIQLVQTPAIITAVSITSDDLLCVSSSTLQCWMVDHSGELLPLHVELPSGRSCAVMRFEFVPSWTYPSGRAGKRLALLICDSNDLMLLSYQLDKATLRFQLQHMLRPSTALASHDTIAHVGSAANGRVLAVTFTNTAVVAVYVYNQTQKMFGDEPILYSLAQAGGPVAIPHFKQYYVIVGVAHDTWMWMSNFEASSLDPLARLSSYYLPPVPLPADNMKTDLGQHGLLSHSGLYLAVLIAVVVWYLLPHLLVLETRVTSWPPLRRLLNFASSGYLFAVVCFVMFCVSLFEIAFQEAFVNDWPCHLAYVYRYFQLDFDYTHYRTFHGDIQYGGGFMHLYALLTLLTGGHLPLFQLLWAVQEQLIYVLMWVIVRRAEIPGFLALLVFSNRLHMYNVRVVINDTPCTLAMVAAIVMILQYRYTTASMLFSFALANKLNVIFYAPAMFIVYFVELPLVAAVKQFMVVVALQLLLAVPFVLQNSSAYVGHTFNLSRTLLWEKTRNFKFVGREFYDDSRFHFLLLVVTALLIVVLLIWFWRTRGDTLAVIRLSSSSFKAPTSVIAKTSHLMVKRARWLVFGFFLLNFVSVAFARGLYTPFMCWYFYAFGLVCYLSEIPSLVTVVFFVLHEVGFFVNGTHNK
eukprot:TRINITY_DN1781_c0_g1_i1.p1 TRINITY_DN1781_c0_g1~~TRINITY_DN1781_c0_g1_i1.p1  ORF type:complete len:843 (+),score=132.48 TRINITY_DN1781_c0_g1_i1:36-2564(+)